MGQFRLGFLSVFLSLSVLSHADTMSLTGNLPTADDVRKFTFTLLTTSDVSFQTFSFGGGTNAAGVTIAGSTSDAMGNPLTVGGFEPDLAVFGPGPGNPLIGFTDPVLGRLPGCPLASEDTVFYAAGFCGDTALVLSGLAPGDYVLGVMAFGNTPALTLAGGFSGGGSFIGAAGELRNSNFAVDVAISPESTVVPEPSTFLTVISAIGILGLRKLRARL